MTRGPLPKKAIAAAQDTGAGRGIVLDAAAMKESHHDFTIFGTSCTVFVRVRRIRTHVIDPQEIAGMCGEDVLQIRRVPLTPVIAREIWTLSPWNCWQYFLILDDRIIEIRRDGTPAIDAKILTGEKPALLSLVPVKTVNDNIPVPAMTANGSAPLPETIVTGSSPAGEAPALADPAPDRTGDAPVLSSATGIPMPSPTETSG
jgi:hypothetical protein